MGLAISRYLLSQPYALIALAGIALGPAIWLLLRPVHRAERPLIARRNRRIFVPLLSTVSVALAGIAILRNPTLVINSTLEVGVMLSGTAIVALLFAALPRWWRLAPALMFVGIVAHAISVWHPVTTAEVRAMTMADGRTVVPLVGYERVGSDSGRSLPVESGRTEILDIALIRTAVREEAGELSVVVMPVLPAQWVAGEGLNPAQGAADEVLNPAPIAAPDIGPVPAPSSSTGAAPGPTPAPSSSTVTAPGPAPLAGQPEGQLTGRITVAHIPGVLWWLPRWRVAGAEFSFGAGTVAWVRDRSLTWRLMPSAITEALLTETTIEIAWPADGTRFIQPGLATLRLVTPDQRGE
jgi:hypothetical protein